MKLIIDIDDEQILFDIINRGLEAETETDKVIINALYNGTPLDDVKAKIKRLRSHSARFRTSDGSVVYVDSHNILEVLDNILDNIGKESEVSE